MKARMTTKRPTLRRLIEDYRRATGIKEVDHRVVAEWAKQHGFTMPVPKDSVDLLAKQLSNLARRDTDRDQVTGAEHRRYHAYTVTKDGRQRTLWLDVEEATRPQMANSTASKRKQMVGEAKHLSAGVEYWNQI
jgi:hypothetical protein